MGTRHLGFLMMAVFGTGCGWPDAPIQSETSPSVDCVSEGTCGYQFWQDCRDKPVCECGPSCAGKPVQITVGDDHSCLRYDTGGVLCWGMLRGVESDPSVYKSENGFWVAPPEPRRPAVTSPKGIDDALSIASGDYHTCVLRQDHTVWCWGRNNHGELGFRYELDERVEYKLPVRLPGLSDVIAICAGNGATSGAQRPARGFGVAGRIFWGPPDSAIGCGEGRGFACLIEPDRTLSCWGDDYSGQLGGGKSGRSVDDYSIPPEVLSDVVSMDGGSAHACALRMNGELWCWGNNDRAVLGNGTVSETIEPPRKVPGLRRVVDFSAAGSMTCAVEQGGQLYCWGGDWTGIMGTGNRFGHVPTPMPITGEEHTRAVAVGYNHGCLIRENDEVACWGDDSSGATGPRAMGVPAGERQVIEGLPRRAEDAVRTVD